MATMYSLFFGVLFTVVCSDKGNGSGVLKFGYTTLFVPPGTDPSFSMTRTYFFSAKKYAKNSSLKTFDTKEVHPLAIVKNFVGDKLRECKVFALICTFIKGRSMSSVMQFAFKDDFLAYGFKGRKATNSSSLHFAQPRPFYLDTTSRSLQSGLMSPVKPSLRAHRRYILKIAMGGTNVRSECSSDDFSFFLGKRRSLSGDEDNNKIRNNKTLLAESRQSIIAIASKELGIREATGNNDGSRVEEYLRYTNLSKGYDWCAAFVSWCYGQAGFAVPRNPWSPALFPKVKLIRKDQCQPADVFGIYGVKVRRINHVGLVKELSKDYLISIEGNSNNRVESRRRHLKTVYAIANWVN